MSAEPLPREYMVMYLKQPNEGNATSGINQHLTWRLDYANKWSVVLSNQDHAQLSLQIVGQFSNTWNNLNYHDGDCQSRYRHCYR